MAEGRVQLMTVPRLVLLCNLRKCSILSCHLQVKGRYKALPMLKKKKKKKECIVRKKRSLKLLESGLRLAEGCTADERHPQKLSAQQSQLLRSTG